MRLLRAFLILMLLATVAVQPVAAAFGGCCCAEPQTQQKACHAPAARQVQSVAPRSCCARTESSQPAPVTSLQRNCCCVKSGPAPRPEVRVNLAKTGSELATIGVLAESTVLVPVATRQATPSTDRTLLAGTTLLSWFCIWLK